MMDELNESLKKGITFIRNNERLKGEPLIREVVKERPGDAWGWLWLSAAVKTNHERRQCVETALQLDPNNQQAKKILSKLKETSVTRQTRLCESSIPPQEAEFLRKEDNSNGLLSAEVTVIRNKEPLTRFKCFH